MSISNTTITAILDRADVPGALRGDPELLAAAYALAFLEDPAEGAEERFYTAATTLPGDTAGERPYEANNRALLTEIYHARLSDRLFELFTADTGARNRPRPHLTASS